MNQMELEGLAGREIIPIQIYLKNYTLQFITNTKELSGSQTCSSEKIEPDRFKINLNSGVNNGK